MLSKILLFIKKNSKNHTKISQTILPFKLRELSWTLLLKPSSQYYPPDVPFLAETHNINRIPVLVNRLENANLSLQISFTF